MGKRLFGYAHNEVSSKTTRKIYRRLRYLFNFDPEAMTYALRVKIPINPIMRAEIMAKTGEDPGQYLKVIHLLNYLTENSRYYFMMQGTDLWLMKKGVPLHPNKPLKNPEAIERGKDAPRKRKVVNSKPESEKLSVPGGQELKEILETLQDLEGLIRKENPET